MVQISTKLLALTTFIGVSVVGVCAMPTTPIARATKCGKLDYGSFKLYAKTTEVDDVAEFYPLKLITVSPTRPTNDTNFVLSVSFSYFLVNLLSFRPF